MECVCNTAPAPTTRTTVRCRGASSEGRLDPPAGSPCKSICTKCSAASIPLSTPVVVIASRKGSRLTTALKFPLVPNVHPRCEKLRLSSESDAAICAADVAPACVTNSNCPPGISMSLVYSRILGLMPSRVNPSNGCPLVSDRSPDVLWEAELNSSTLFSTEYTEMRGEPSLNLRALLCLRGETGRLAAAASLFESQIGGGIDHRKTCHKSHEFFLLQSNLRLSTKNSL